MALSTHYTTTHELTAALTADYRPSGRFRGNFVVRVAGTVAPLVLEDARGNELIFTTLTDTMVNRGLDNPILCRAVKRQSADGNTTTGTLSATNKLTLGWPETKV